MATAEEIANAELHKLHTWVRGAAVLLEQASNYIELERGAPTVASEKLRVHALAGRALLDSQGFE